ncbi:MAG: hypothetical protein K8S54_11675 [Spirochaetia bacterium]|nr:hypothetical protein [Spirochaetia bacterium]
MKRFVLPALIFAYALAFRIHGIEDHFLLLGDQIRDWRIVSGGFTDLPLLGTPRHSGGFSHGPIFYWILWLSRQLIGPFTNQLPHAGGIGIAIFYSFSAAALYRALLNRMSFAFSTTAILFIVSSPWEASFSGNAAWNPGVAVGFVNLSMAAALAAVEWKGRIVAIALGWLAFQAHVPAIFFFTGLLAGMIALEFRQFGPGKSFSLFVRAAIVLLILQIPYLAAMHRGELLAGGPILDSLIRAIENPSSIHPTSAYRFIRRGAVLLLFENSEFVQRYTAFLVVPWILGILSLRPKGLWLFLAFLPVLGAILGYSISQIEFDLYHLVTLMSSFVLLFVLGVQSLARWTRLPLWIAFCYILVQQPQRFAQAPTDRMDSYGSLIRGARKIVESGRKFSGVEFQEPGPDPLLVLECLGKHATPGSPIALIDAKGNVEWRE